jgi:hypothetical protein
MEANRLPGIAEFPSKNSSVERMVVPLYVEDSSRVDAWGDNLEPGDTGPRFGS